MTKQIKIHRGQYDLTTTLHEFERAPLFLHLLA
jgi:hypothetical protein